MATLQVTQRLRQVLEDIAEIKGRNPGFHNELKEENIHNPESVADFRIFMNLKRRKIDLQKRLNRVEAIRINAQSIREARVNFRGRALNLDDVDDSHLPPLRNSISTRMSTLTLSPISDSRSVHSTRSGSQSPILGMALPDSDQC